MSSVIGNFIRMSSLDYSTMMDPVNKYRVSTPESLIDTDFEYGLQAVKWETIQQVANIPTFFSRTGDPPIAVTNITSRSNMDVVYITLASSNITFNVGSPFFIQGLQSGFAAAEGGFIVNRIISPFTIVYRSKQVLNFSGSIYDPNGTAVYQGYFYSASMYSLDQLASITTDSNIPATLTVTTREPHGFNNGTQFNLVNSFGRKQYTFNTSANALNVTFSNVYNSATNSSNTFFILPNNDLQDNTILTYSNLYGAQISNLPVPLGSSTFVGGGYTSNLNFGSTVASCNVLANGSNFYVYNSYANYFQLSTVPLNSNFAGNPSALLSCTSNGPFPSCNVFYTIDNATDGSIYTLCNVPTPSSFQMVSTGQIIPNTIYFLPRTTLNLTSNCFTFPIPHRQAAGAPIGYSNMNNQSIQYLNAGGAGGASLSNYNIYISSNSPANIYYAIPLDAYSLQLSPTPQYYPPYSNITLDYPLSTGTLNGLWNGSNSLSFLSITGQTYGQGTISASNVGINTFISTNNLSTLFKIGDTIRIEIPGTSNVYNAVTSAVGPPGTLASGTPPLPVGFSGQLFTAQIINSGTSGLANSNIYYLRQNGTNSTYQVYTRYIDAVNGVTANATTVAAGTVNSLQLLTTGATFEPQISFIGSSNKIQTGTVFSNIAQYNGPIYPSFSNFIGSNLRYFIRTGLYPRADGFTLHRAYDGGIELIPPRCADGQVIRQTRRYFRYQPGKGIQVSLSVNFSAPLDVDKVFTSNVNSSQVIVITKSVHRLSSNLPIIVDFVGLTNSTVPAGIYPQVPLYPWTASSNQVSAPGPYPTYTINNVINNNTFSYIMNGTPAQYGYTSNTSCNIYNLSASNYVTAPGIPLIYVNGWSNSKIRTGMFDDQNGMFFEYDGSNMYAVRRESTTQITGQSIVNNLSQLVTGQLNFNQYTVNTSYTSQLKTGSNIVIRGQTYRVASIINDSNFYIQPAYRGVSSSNVIISKVNDYRIPQNQWNIDVCDGTGPTGYVLDIHKIQMIYFDYSWYGAGKIRFGFKDPNGNVRYVHEMIHNNNAIIAFLRSGNLPARYEVQNYGQPTWVPSLMHWGTSVIMDGRYDDDKAYLFTASANIIQYTAGDSITIIASCGSNYGASNGAGSYGGTIVGNLANPSIYNSAFYGPGFNPPDISATTQLYDAYTQSTQTAYSIYTTAQTAYNSLLAVASNIWTGPYINGYQGCNISTLIQYNASYKDVQNIRSGTIITGCNIPVGTTTVGTPQRGATFGYTTGTGAVLYTGQIFINKQPSVPFLCSPVTIGIPGTDLIPQLIPLVSIRLSPSVDSSVTGLLGARELINRMQLKLRSIDILTTNDTECRVYLNSTIDNPNWVPSTVPSLAQLIKHNKGDILQGGIQIFSYRVAGGSTDATGKRSTSVTSQDLQLLGSIQNSIIGGNNIYPDGPDIITVAAVCLDSAGVSATTPYIVSSRITWTEAQA